MHGVALTLVFILFLLVFVVYGTVKRISHRTGMKPLSVCVLCVFAIFLSIGIAVRLGAISTDTASNIFLLFFVPILLVCAIKVVCMFIIWALKGLLL